MGHDLYIHFLASSKPVTFSAAFNFFFLSVFLFFFCRVSLGKASAASTAHFILELLGVTLDPF